MNWKIRHQGSPMAIEGLTLAQVVEGLQDGQWELTDEVMGPDDRDWVAIENHPRLEEIVADLEPLSQPSHDDETRLDMNALIDVTLVLLIFFILTTSYAAIQMIIEAPPVRLDDETKLPVISDQEIKEQMIHVKVSMEGDQPVIRVEEQPVELDALLSVLAGFTGGDQRKTNLLLESTEDVSRETVISIQDKAKGAGVQKIFRLVPKPGESK
jgi:biopolymer transport protein ExbD